MIIWVTIRTNTTRIGGQAANAETVADEAGQPLSPISTYLRRQAANAGTGANEAAPPLPPIKAPNAEIRPVKHLPSECLQCNKPCAAYRNFCQYSCKTMAESGAPKLIAIHGGHHMHRDSEFLSITNVIRLMNLQQYPIYYPPHGDVMGRPHRCEPFMR